jgi:hypothetical protein
VRTFSFFTIQSNILAMVTSAQLAIAPSRDGRGWRVLRLDALVGITVTGVVYSTVLARVHEPKGWEQVTTNTLFHYVVPVAMVTGWLLFGPRPRIDRFTVLAALGWPVAWFAYTLVRGSIDSWYPYPFVDVISHGYGRVALNAVVVTVVLGLVEALYWVGDRWLPRSPRASRRRFGANYLCHRGVSERGRADRDAGLRREAFRLEVRLPRNP